MELRRRVLRGQKDDALALMEDQALEEQQSDKGLAEADAVAEERPTELTGDARQSPIRLLLVPIEAREHLRLALVPLRVGDLVAAEELVERLGIDVERSVLARVPLDDAEHGVADVDSLFPMGVEPVLELLHVPRALDLDVQLDVLGEARSGEVAGADERLGTHDLELGVGDVRLRVELGSVVD